MVAYAASDTCLAYLSKALMASKSLRHHWPKGVSQELVDALRPTYIERIFNDEMKAQLQRLPSNSAPGLDHLPYKVWMVFDPNGILLACIFEMCRKWQRIPSAWKRSTTILLYKKGDVGVLSDRRPIAL